MLVAVYLVLFALVLLFAWAIDARYGRSRAVSHAAEVERARLALLYAVGAQSLQARSQHPQRIPGNLRASSSGKPLKPGAQPALDRDSLANDTKMAAQAKSLARDYHRMSLVYKSSHAVGTGAHGSFSPKSNPAKLALVPRDRSIPA